MPFNYRNKRTFAAKVAVFFTVGFGIPFVAVKYQLYVSDHAFGPVTDMCLRWKAGAGGEAK